MDASLLKNRYSLDIADLPNPQGMNVVTIDHIDSEEYFSREDKQMKWRHKLYLVGFRLPLSLNNSRIDVLMALLGKDTDSWVNRKIGLYVGPVERYGKTEAGVLIHLQACDHLPAIGSTPATGAAANFRASTASGNQFAQQVQPQHAPAATQPATFDVRAIGTANADKFKQALAEQGATLDDVLGWMKDQAFEAWQRCTGTELVDWPRGCAPEMQRFCREWQTWKSKPKPPAGSLAFKPDPEDDIPF